MADQDTPAVTAPIQHPNVDPAALLVAVLSAGIGPLLSVGAWNIINTLVALVVLAVILAYSWPRRATLKLEREKQIKVTTRPDGWTIGAQALVYGFLVGIASAWIVQWIAFGDKECSPLLAGVVLRLCEAQVNENAGMATNWALGIGLLAAFGFYFGMIAATKRLIAADSRPAAISSSAAIHVAARTDGTSDASAEPAPPER